MCKVYKNELVGSYAKKPYEKEVYSHPFDAAPFGILLCGSCTAELEFEIPN